MVNVAILCSGPSLSEKDINLVKQAKENNIIHYVIAVSDTAKLAPWADALVSHDAAWWKYHGHWARKLPMKKYSRQTSPGVEIFVPPTVTSGCNSGLMAAFVARDKYEAKKILYLGLDMKEGHFFGKHPTPLKNANINRINIHIRQFDSFSGCDIINCTINSGLKKYPIIPLEEALKKL